MLLTRTQTNLRNIAVFLGITQGATWALMSFICIIVHFTKDLDDSAHLSHMDQVNAIIFYRYLTNNDRVYMKRFIYPSAFTGFVFCYLIIDIIWLLVSLHILCNKRNPNIFVRWSIITWIVCGLDFLFVILLGVDYDKCLSAYDVDYNPFNYICADGILPVLIIAAKGFVLWFVNLIFGIVLFKMSKSVKQAPQQQYGQTSTHISNPADYYNQGYPSSQQYPYNNLQVPQSPYGEANAPIPLTQPQPQASPVIGASDYYNQNQPSVQPNWYNSNNQTREADLSRYPQNQNFQPNRNYPYPVQNIYSGQSSMSTLPKTESNLYNQAGLSPSQIWQMRKQGQQISSHR